MVELEKRKLALETVIEGKLKSRESNSTVDPGLRKSQEELLDLHFQIECTLQASLGSTRRVAKPGVAADSVIEVTTYFATNRKSTNSAEPAKFYGSERDATPNFGRAIVTIPPDHVPGNLELPSVWKLERAADPEKHFVLKSISSLDRDGVRKEMAEKLQSANTKSVLLFVHGYNSGFEDAALRTAQLAHDLKFPGLPFFFSWPSAQKTTGYWHDEEVALLSEPLFEQVVADLSLLPETDLYIVAHSMGNRIVTGALRSRIDKKEETKHIRELLLAAPDVNAEIFREVIAPKLNLMQNTRVTVYAASTDLALKASKLVHGFSRLGDTGGTIFTHPGIDTIDASGASTMTRAFGHSYLMDSPPVIRDISETFEKKIAAAKRRTLIEMGASPSNYWRLQ